ncbi:head maturation protease, ClpP-related [Microbacterium sp. AG238]|uniref:head maturation protease, ClpP-related n=1 Tax=Microbacterium sp. AG238 TaxID=2183994 RepID=UPI000E71503C|nr:head maturation protease, ClpP-related [Microbacterium sp. AG238]RKE60455.1 ATP-dependent Clp endopeptidase proteolytic subunit ClpP [Microbacterium sp. AG238]
MNPFRPPGRASTERTPIRAEAPSARTDGSVATLRLYDPIDSYGEWWGISAKEFTRELDLLPDEVDEIRLLINSPGGEVWEGIAIMNALRQHKAKTVAVVEGIAASSASFIAVSCDELVMMRNSELYIHNAWGTVIGDATDLRSVADDLETHYDRNIASVYAAKSGDSVEHWLAEMEKDRYLTADEAVAEKLADRVEGDGDAESAKARFDLSVFARSDGRRAAARAVSPKTPGSPEPGNPNQKEALAMSDTIKAGLIERLGVKDADISDEALLAAVDEALEEQAPTEDAPAVATLPKGFVAVDENVWNETQANARQGAEARAQQEKDRRDGIVAAALRSGQISTASASAIREQLDTDEKGTVAFLATVPKNSVPVEPVGVSDTLTSTDDALYNAMYGAAEKGA